jgi:hypothetical protein
MQRKDLDVSPEIAAASISAMLKRHGEQGRELIAVQDQVLRELAAATGHGGVSAVARVVGVSHVQAGRRLVNGLGRAIVAAAEKAGVAIKVSRRGQAYPPVLLVELDDEDRDDYDDEDRDDYDDVDADRDRIRSRSEWIGRMNAAGTLLEAFRAAGLEAVDDTGLVGEVDNHGPRHALAERRTVEVSWK